MKSFLWSLLLPLTASSFHTNSFVRSPPFLSSSRLASSDGDEALPQGFDTIALHGGYTPDTEATYGLGECLSSIKERENTLVRII